MQQRTLNINDLIDLIHNADSSKFYIDLSRGKNRNTLKKYRLNSDDVIDYVKSLTTKEYAKTERCDDVRFNVDVWYIFHSITYLYAIDNILDRVRLFIRIGLDINGEIIIIVRSFHEDDC